MAEDEFQNLPPDSEPALPPEPPKPQPKIDLSDWAAPPVGKEEKKTGFFSNLFKKKEKKKKEEKPKKAKKEKPEKEKKRLEAPVEKKSKPTVEPPEEIRESATPLEVPEPQPASEHQDEIVPSDDSPSQSEEEAVYSKPPSKLFKRLKVLLILLFIAGGGAYAAKKFLLDKKEEKPKISLEQTVAQEEKKEEGPVPVKGFKVGRFNFEDSLNQLGTLKGSVEFKLSFEVPGTISSINYREGERYEEGALLISLRQDDVLLRLKRAQAEMNKAQTQTKIAEEKVKEHKKLLKLGAISKIALENARLEYESSKYEAEAARLEVKANEAMLEKSNLYAPSAGMIGELNIEEGETITPNTLLGTHINTEFVYAEFGVVERDVNKIALGQKARVFVDAYPDKTFEGVIENIAPVVAGTSRTASARVRVENPDRLLLPGMFTRIRILLYSKKNTLVIPTDAIQGGEGEQFVYVVHSEKGSEPSDAGSSTPEPEGEEADGGASAGKKQPAAIAPEKEIPPQAKNASEKEGAKPAAKKENEIQTVEKRAITVGYTRPDYSQIDAGISEGEVIAISGLERLEDGKKAKLLEVQEAEI